VGRNKKKTRALSNIKHLVLLFWLITRGWCWSVTPFPRFISHIYIVESPYKLQKFRDSVNPFGGTGFPPCTETSFCNNVIESFLLLPDLYKKKKGPFLTFWTKSSAVFLEKQSKDLRAAGASRQSKWIDESVARPSFGSLCQGGSWIGYPRNWCYYSIAEEAPLAVQEMPANAAKAGPVMAWLECCIRITVVANATGVIFFLITCV